MAVEHVNAWVYPIDIGIHFENSRKFFRVDDDGSSGIAHPLPSSWLEFRPWLGRIEPVEIPVKLVFYLLAPGKFDLSFRNFGISISLFHRASSPAFQIRSF